MVKFWRKIRYRLQDKKFFYRLLIVLIVILILVLYRFFIYHFTYSRYAYVYANVVNINSRVPGTISEIKVTNNQPVKRGDLLLQLDQRPYIYALNHAKAVLHQAEVEYNTTQTAIQIAEANLKLQQSNLGLVQDHLKRYQTLVKTDSVPVIKYVDYYFRAMSMQDNVASAEQELVQSKEALTDAKIRQAEAELLRAKYDYEYSTVYAPIDGDLTNFELLVGDYVDTGQGLFALVDTSEWWIITRYRETVVRKIKIGDEVKIFIDMYPWKIFHGVVESIDWGINRQQASTDVTESTLPYVEATEYWIRLAQRFPVWIRITDADPEKYPLRVGANARTYVVTK